MNKQTSSLPKYLANIQALRGLAAILVVLYHIAGQQRLMLTPDMNMDLELLRGFWDRGYVGVDLFFVISGFVMVYVTRNSSPSFTVSSTFFKARLARIYPLWWAYVLILPLYYWLAHHGSAEPFQVNTKDEIIPHIIKSFFLVPQEFMPVLIVGWTLIHELFFYVVFAGLLLLPRRLLPVGLLIWTLLTIGGYLAGFTNAGTVGLLSLASSLYSLEFLAGAFIGLLITQRMFKFSGGIAIIGAISFAIACLFYTNNGEPVSALSRVIVYTLPCAAMIYGLSVLEIQKRIRIPKWMVHIGNWSYSLYLSHLIVLIVINRVFEFLAAALPSGLAKLFAIGSPGPLDNIFHAGVSLTACILFSGVSYYSIERPLLKISRRTLRL